MRNLLPWALLAVLSLALTAGLLAVSMPAATLLGPMVAGIVLALTGRVPALTPRAAQGAQGLLGLMIAQSLSPEMLGQLALRWPIIAFGTLSTVALAAGLGWLLARSPLLPGTTAIWGAMPGAASVITLAAGAHGADMRLVAFMQYLRVALVALSAALVARAFGLHGAGETLWLTPVAPSGLALTLAAAAGLSALGQASRLAGGAFLVPMLGGIFLHHVAGLDLPLPPLLMALAYAAIGWTIGLRFTRTVIEAAWRILPRVLGAILTLILACSVAALALSQLAGIDLLTAWLATSPGGADSIAIIASQVAVDLPFVMTMQMSRFLLVLFAGPTLARLLSRAWIRAGKNPQGFRF